MIKIGKFSRVLKKDGTLLFKSYFKDSVFLSSIRRFFHSIYGTEFNISFIKQTSKGFHIKLKEVTSQKEAGYFVGEEFSLPNRDVAGKSIDLVSGMEVVSMSGKVLGIVQRFSETKGYYIVTVQGEQEFSFPFTENFAKVEEERIVLIREDFLEI